MSPQDSAAARKKILIVEDDPNATEVLLMNLQGLGYDLESTHDGQDALERAFANDYELIILDHNIPSLIGPEVCRRIREQNTAVRILLLTGRSTEIDKVLGLEVGADDYITKPFSIPELVARVRALLRRGPAAQSAASTIATPAERLTVGRMTIDLLSRQVHADEKLIPLSFIEFNLLAYLASYPGRAFTREQIIEAIWEDRSGESDELMVNVHINRLRSKIEPNPDQPVYLITVRKVGYRFASAEELAKLK